MLHAMVRRSFAVVGVVALAGCAQDGPRPAYIGLSDLAGDAFSRPVEPAVSEDAPEVLRHIQSNKVLGAMAFQKITGQTVDPDSLLGHGQ
ncbi:hypothetical protein [Hyphomicrobium sp.]|jgi:hypothetical protein|uniref:hypothetical protein n=1 Tax=Hyphomicrobium sp. TaxID=82 RepID=UPI000FA1F7BD|nr:hypothetical protein [Hyphomicrobium sp.]RUO99320.1 MAG: hypothetical protein EKK30_05240 [Hyphomicrobium sp.]